MKPVDLHFDLVLWGSSVSVPFPYGAELIDGAAVSIGELPPVEASVPAVCYSMSAVLVRSFIDMTYDSDCLGRASDCDSYLRLAATANTTWSRAANRAITFLYAGRSRDRLDCNNSGERGCLRDRRSGRAVGGFAGRLETASGSALGCVDGLISCQSPTQLVDHSLFHTSTLVSVRVWWMVVVTTVAEEPEPRV